MKIYRLLVLFILVSCSLEYDVAVKKLEEQGIPDLVFETAKLDRYSDEKLSTKVEAEVLEFYGKEDRIYGKNTSFTIFDGNDEITAEGKATMIDANQSTEEYSLLKGAEISSYTQGMHIKGENFNWNNKTEQLVAGLNDEVTIEYGTLNNRDITLRVMGKGFAASTLGMDYRFTEKSIGYVDTDSKNSSGPPPLPISIETSTATDSDQSTNEGAVTDGENPPSAMPTEVGVEAATEENAAGEPISENADGGDILEN